MYLSVDPFAIGKRPYVTNLMTGISNNSLPQPRYTFILDAETVRNFLDTLDSNKIELNWGPIN